MSTETTSAPAIRYASVTFDCPDPAELARFYGEVLGLPVRFSSDDFILLGKEGSTGLSFNRLAATGVPPGRTPFRRSRPISNWASTTWTPPRHDCSPSELSRRRLNLSLPSGGSCWTPPVIRSASPPWAERGSA